MNDNVHAGHRARMRRKFSDFSHRVFDTYELLEMLLYYTVKVRDTNPIAKALLRNFSSLDSVLSANTESLAKSEGCGGESADLIYAVDELHDVLLRAGKGEHDGMTEDKICTHILSLIGTLTEPRIIMLSFTNSAQLIATDELYSIDYSSAAVTPQPFVDAAIRARASFVIIAHNHPYSSLFPGDGDRQTNALIESALRDVGITLGEHFIVSGGKIMGFMNSALTPHDISRTKSSTATGRECNLRITKWLPSLNIPTESPSALNALFSTDIYALRSTLPDGEANLIRLISALLSRRITSRFPIERRYDEESIRTLLCGIFYGEPNENIHMLCLDKSGALIVTEHVTEGTVNASGMLPRRLLDIAARHKTREIILAHNHPSGQAIPSESDIKSTKEIKRILSVAGITLRAHYTVAGMNAMPIECEA